MSEVQFSFDALSFLQEVLPEPEEATPTDSIIRRPTEPKPVEAKDENQTMLQDFARLQADQYDLKSMKKAPPVKSNLIQDYLDNLDMFYKDEQMNEAINSALMEATRPPIGQMSETARTAMFSGADMQGSELTMMDNAREAQDVVQPMVTPVFRGRQPEMADSPAPVDAPSIDARSNEMLDKPVKQPVGIMARPALTDDDMGITSKPIPTYIVPKTKAEIKETQKSLSEAGYYSAKLAKIDGLKGSNYENAIKSFQYNNDLKVTGEIDEPTSVLLREGESSFVTNPKPSDPLLSFISSGEGGYGAANNGTSSRLKKKGKLFSVYDSYYSDENSKPLQNMTVIEILNSQTGNTGLSLQQLKDYMKGNTNKKGKYTAPSRELDNREFFAVGAYQIIPTTMMAAVNSMGLTGEETFTPQLQDKIAKDFLSSKKRPFLNNYLIGAGSVSLEKAMDDIAKEWASLPTSSGGSHYSGQSSAHTIEEAKEVLKNSKAKYEAENLGLGV